jgi:hypothetical protein
MAIFKEALAAPQSWLNPLISPQRL